MEPTTAKVTAAVEVIRKRNQQVRDRKEPIGEARGALRSIYDLRRRFLSRGN